MRLPKFLTFISVSQKILSKTYSKKGKKTNKLPPTLSHHYHHFISFFYSISAFLNTSDL